MERTYTNSEVEQILKIALESRTINSGNISVQNLFEIAKELNIDEASIFDAVRKFESGTSLTNSKEEYNRKRRKKFFEHLTSYAIINAFLVLMDFFTDGRISWSIFPILGWGIGLTFDAIDKLSFDKEKFEKYIEKEQKRNRKRVH